MTTKLETLHCGRGVIFAYLVALEDKTAYAVSYDVKAGGFRIGTEEVLSYNITIASIRFAKEDGFLFAYTSRSQNEIDFSKKNVDPIQIILYLDETTRTINGDL